MILENLALSENDILNFKAIRVPNIALKKVNKLIIILSIKFFHFFFFLLFSNKIIIYFSHIVNHNTIILQKYKQNIIFDINITEI